MTASHPLIALRRVDVFKRRPRLTSQEALVLNAIVNGEGEPVALDHLVAVLYRGRRTFRSDRRNASRVVSSLRAKLGEERNRPIQIVTEHVERRGQPVVAYRYVENWEG